MEPEPACTGVGVCEWLKQNKQTAGNNYFRLLALGGHFFGLVVGVVAAVGRVFLLDAARRALASGLVVVVVFHTAVGAIATRFFLFRFAWFAHIVVVVAAAVAVVFLFRFARFVGVVVFGTAICSARVFLFRFARTLASVIAVIVVVVIACVAGVFLFLFLFAVAVVVRTEIPRLHIQLHTKTNAHVSHKQN